MEDTSRYMDDEKYPQENKRKEHKKSNQGFASPKYDPEKKRAAQSLGGSACVPKGFAKMHPDKRREIAKKGGKS